LRKKSKPSSVGDILAKMAKTTELGKKLEQAIIWERWPEVAGASLFEHGRPHSIRENTLIVEVDSSVWMNKYAYHKWHILKRINRLSGRELVSDIFVKLRGEECPEPSE